MRHVCVVTVLLLLMISSFPPSIKVSPLPAVAGSEVAAKYAVEITDAGAAKHELRVRAVLSLSGATDLSVSPEGDNSDQWITIEDCYDAEGSVPVAKIDNRTWRVGPGSIDAVTVEYRAYVNMPNRMTEGTYLAYLSGECGLISARSILLTPSTAITATVNFVMPAGWTVITDERWTRLNATSFSVSTGDLDLIAPGRWDVYDETFGDGQRLRVAICGETMHAKGEYVTNIKACLDYFHEHVGRLPQSEMNVVLADLPIPVDYMSYSPRLAVNRAGRDWGMFEGMLWHYWFLRSARYDNQVDADRAWWFGEGASPFILYPVYESIGAAEEVAAAWGFKYPGLTWENWYAVYEPYIGTEFDIPLVDYPERSRETSDIRYYTPMPYMKSHVVLQMLNLSISEFTQGEKDLRDVIGYVYENYADKGIGYSVEDILDAANQVSGNDYTGFFDAYVYGDEPLPVVEDGEDRLFDWATLGDKVYPSTPNTEKVRPWTQRSVPSSETATLLEMKKESRHFTVYFHGQDSKMAALLLLDSEKAHDAVAKLYGGDAKLRIRLFMTYNGTEYAVLGGNPEAVYDEGASAGGVAVEAGDEINWLRPIPLSATQVTDIAAPIHELGHAMLRQLYPGIYRNWEQWFNEGMPLARMAWLDEEWASPNRTPFDPSPTAQLRKSLLGGSPAVIPLTTLASMDYGSLNASQRLLNSGEGTSFHFYVWARYEDGFRRLLVEYDKGVPLATAVEHAFGLTYADLERDLWATALKAALNDNATEAVVSKVRREGVNVTLADRLTDEDPFLASLVAYALEARAGAGPVRLSLGALDAGTSARADLPTTPVASISVSAAQRVENLTITVQEIEPTGISPPVGGEFYCYLSINCSTGSIGPVTLTLRIENTWLTGHDVNASWVVLSRLQDGAWSPLPTSVIGRDASNTYLSAESPSLSTFAITAQRVEREQPSPSIDCWVSPSAFGPPATSFLLMDGVHPTVTNSGYDGPLIRVALTDHEGAVLVDRSYNVGHGMTGYGDYNPEKSLTAGSYAVKVWSGSILLKRIDISLSTPPPPSNQTKPSEPSEPSNQTKPSQPPGDQTTPGQKSGCIIATATYGSELAPQVQFLRGFRDDLVMRTLAGRGFMTVFNAWYYSWSPAVAASIASDPSAKAVMRAVLQPLLSILELSAATYRLFPSNGELGVVSAGLVASSLIGLVYVVPPATLVSVAVRRRRGSLPPPRKVGFLAIPWAASMALLAIGEALSLPAVLMAATASLVLLTVGIVAGSVSLCVARLFPHFPRQIEQPEA
jgi:PGF-pre-PGF domain-containing protein